MIHYKKLIPIFIVLCSVFFAYSYFSSSKSARASTTNNTGTTCNMESADGDSFGFSCGDSSTSDSLPVCKPTCGAGKKCFQAVCPSGVRCRLAAPSCVTIAPTRTPTPKQSTTPTPTASKTICDPSCAKGFICYKSCPSCNDMPRCVTPTPATPTLKTITASYIPYDGYATYIDANKDRIQIFVYPAIPGISTTSTNTSEGGKWWSRMKVYTESGVLVNAAKPYLKQFTPSSSPSRIYNEPSFEPLFTHFDFLGLARDFEAAGLPSTIRVQLFDENDKPYSNLSTSFTLGNGTISSTPTPHPLTPTPTSTTCSKICPTGQQCYQQKNSCNANGICTQVAYPMLCVTPTPLPTSIISTTAPTSTPRPPTSTPLPSPTLDPCRLRNQGDANCNTIVDNDDFERWRTTMRGGAVNACLGCSTDFNSDNKTDMADYEIWRNTFYK